MRTSKQAQAPSSLHNVLPPQQQQQLRLAAAVRDYEAMDAITDDLVRMGLCRPRWECAWMTRADLVKTMQHPRAGE